MNIDERIASIEQGYVIEPQGMRILRDEFTERDWVIWGQLLVARHESTQWAIGDWLIAGARQNWANNNQYTGSAFQKAAEITGFEVERLRLYARVATAFPPDSRRSKLNFSIHVMATTLVEDSRQEALSKAEYGEGDGKPWSTTQFKDYLDSLSISGLDKAQTHRRHRKKGNTGKPPVEAQCPHCGRAILIKAFRGGRIAVTKEEQ